MAHPSLLDDQELADRLHELGNQTVSRALRVPVGGKRLQLYEEADIMLEASARLQGEHPLPRGRMGWIGLTILLILGITLLVASCGPEAQTERPERMPLATELSYCLDGDTCLFTAWPRTTVRLARIDSPELDGRCPAAAQLAQRLLESKLLNADRIIVDSLRIGFYGRIIAEVYADGENLSEYMLNSHLAQPYGEPTCIG